MEAASSVYLSIISMGELSFGAENSTRKTENFERIARILSLVELTTCDPMTASIYGRIASE